MTSLNLPSLFLYYALKRINNQSIKVVLRFQRRLLSFSLVLLRFLHRVCAFSIVDRPSPSLFVLRRSSISPNSALRTASSQQQHRQIPPESSSPRQEHRREQQKPPDRRRFRRSSSRTSSDSPAEKTRRPSWIPIRHLGFKTIAAKSKQNHGFIN